MGTRTATIVSAIALTAFAAGVEANSHGKTVYEQTCVVCHGADGKGAIPGVPALGGKTGILTKGDAELLSNIMQGFQTPGSTMAMPAKGGNPSLTTEDAAAVLAYMRKAFAP